MEWSTRSNQYSDSAAISFSKTVHHGLLHHAFVAYSTAIPYLGLLSDSTAIIATK
jgi:hypothetical protein